MSWIMIIVLRFYVDINWLQEKLLSFVFLTSESSMYFLANLPVLLLVYLLYRKFVVTGFIFV